MSGPAPRRALGTAGEGHAERYLVARGYRLLARQWRGGGGELDLVMRHGDELVAVEVKTRHGDSHGRATEAVSKRQAAALLRATEAYAQAIEASGRTAPIWRVDLVAVTLDAAGRVVDVTHIENAIVADGLSGPSR